MEPATAQVDAIPQAADSYFQNAQSVLAEKLAQTPNTNRARNIILFIGDGMSIATLTAARIYAGQKIGADGVSHRLTMEKLPYAALSRTYSHDFQVADSAPTATAMTTGVKTINNLVGLDRTARLGDCLSKEGAELLTLFEMAEMAGLSTGIVSTTRITHATPASAYAHTPHRNWEADSDMPLAATAAGCTDIARQLVEWPFGDGFEVVFGGGRQKFLPANAADPEYPDLRGVRADGRDLTAEWVSRRDGAIYVWNAEAFDALGPAQGGPVLGLFEPSDMQFEADRANDAAGEPSLAQMTAKAIGILGQNRDGFVLMVEGGRIDHAHHAGNAARALEDTLAFDAALTVALAGTDPAETLIVVTADHGHTLTISGYPARGNPILGLVAGADGHPALAGDGKPYTTLGYANGPGAAGTGGATGAAGAGAGERADLTGIDTADIDFRQQSLVPLGAETHGGEDVAIFASGPFAHLFQGVVDEHFIFHVLAHASAMRQRAGLR